MRRDVGMVYRLVSARAKPPVSVLLLLVLFCATGCTDGAAQAAGAGKNRQGQDTQGDAAAHKRKVRLVAAQNVRLADSVSVSGTLSAHDTVVVSAKVPGRLASISVDLGSKVTRGQVIGQIEQADFRLRVAQAAASVAQARALLGLAPTAEAAKVDVEGTPAVRQARATLEEAQKNLERSQTLLDRKLIGRADFDAVQANFARAESTMASAREEIYNRQALLRQREAELAIAQKALADSSIVAPLDGIVQLRSRTAGELLAAGMPIVTIVNVDPLRLRLEVPDHAATRVQVGQQVRVVPSQEREQEHKGQLMRVAPAIDEQNRTLTVEAEIPNPGTLKPGSFVRAELVLGDQTDVLAVPTRAIVVFAGIEKVITVHDGKAEEVVIGTGRRTGELTEVKSGLKEGAEVVLEPGNLQTGDSVEVDQTGEPHRAEAG